MDSGRRQFLNRGSWLALASALPWVKSDRDVGSWFGDGPTVGPREPRPHAAGAPVSGAAVASPGETFPTQEPSLTREMVGVSHGNVARVRELLAERPTLAKAAWDWGYGDWETALGAASHVGNREIAELLIASGARPDLFTAAMLGHVDVVRGFVSASPGIQRLRGPHGIPLLAHATAGGAAAAPVVAYLESLGGAGERYAEAPLSAEITALSGRYSFGAGSRDAFDVEAAKSANRTGTLGMRRLETSAQNLFHVGDRAFHTPGNDVMRVRFAPGSPCPSLVVHDGQLILEAKRVAPSR